MNTSTPPVDSATLSAMRTQDDSVPMDTSDVAISSPVDDDDESVINLQREPFSFQAYAENINPVAVNTPPPAAAATKHKCNVKGCPEFDLILPLKRCLLDACDKVIHPVYYEKLLSRAKTLT